MLVTIAEFETVPDPAAGHNELHGGEVVLVPPPKWGHTRLQKRLELLLGRHTGDKFEVFVELPFRPKPEHEVWVADVALVGRQRPQPGDHEYFEGASALVVEVLSPGNTIAQMEEERAICIAGGCLSFWLVDAARQEVHVTEGGTTQHYRADSHMTGSQIVSRVLPQPIATGDIFD